MGEKFVWHAGQWMPAARYYALSATQREEARSKAVPTPAVMGDLQPHRNMVTGDYVTSRSRHREILREYGLVELGNERIEPRKPYEPQGVEQDVKRAYDYLASGGPAPQAESDIVPKE